MRDSAVWQLDAVWPVARPLIVAFAVVIGASVIAQPARAQRGGD